ncbi:hypothetical protein [Pseudoroseomonas cervicalis]|uniref:hypothetical protein n=1 Tax=Teichococcus cervicalis TaxID=204525 RepID=UPI00278A197E|nr:hypothetical protein [Pseudoroseomonas cervicalis]MDQ1078022.1 hypothetical protein [Pseudoroseomonas cervicalis]
MSQPLIDNQWFRGALEKWGMRQADFCRFLIARGDPRPLKTIQQHVRRLWHDESPGSGEMRALISMLDQHGPG